MIVPITLLLVSIQIDERIVTIVLYNHTDYITTKFYIGRWKILTLSLICDCTDYITAKFYTG